MQRLGPEGCKRASKMTSCMDNRGRQRKSLTNSLRGKIHSHNDLEISLILGTGQLKQKSMRFKPANHYYFSSPASFLCSTSSAPKTVNILTQIQKSNTTERRKTLLWVLTGNYQGSLKQQNTTVSHKHMHQGCEPR